MDINPITTTEIFIDADGNHMTRLWEEAKGDGGVNGQVMSIIPTDPSQIRPRRQSMCAVIALVYKDKSITPPRTNIFDPI